MSRTPRVSILMPAYNAAAYVVEAIESILAQSFEDFELLVLDDGSTDGSDRLIERLAEREARLRFVRHPHAGHTQLLNRGLAETRAELVARMDADDVALPERLERQIGYLEEHPECVCLGTAVQLIDADGDPLGPLPVQKQHDAIETELLAGRGSAMVHPSVVYRRSTVLEVGGYDARWRTGQDLALFLELAEVGRLANLPETLLKFRKHFRSVTNGISQAESDRRRAAILREACARRGIEWNAARVRTFRQPASQAEAAAQWAAIAVNAGHYRTAAKHVRAMLRERPFGWRTWSALAGIAARRLRAALRERRSTPRPNEGAAAPTLARSASEGWSPGGFGPREPAGCWYWQEMSIRPRCCGCGGCSTCSRATLRHW